LRSREDILGLGDLDYPLLPLPSSTPLAEDQKLLSDVE